MMAANTPSIDEQAAVWFDRMNRSAFDSADGQSFDAWMTADSRHREAFTDILAMWESEALETACAAEPESAAQPDKAPASRWNRAVGATAIASAAAVLALVLVPALPHDYASAPGETRRIALSDGSTVDLGGNSAVRVQFLPWRRAIDLDRGEASFDIAKDAARPLSVRIGATQVNVLGTAFHIDRLAEGRVIVAVSRGQVRVVSGSDELALGASQAAQAMAGRLVRTRLEPEQKIASGWFVAKNAPLADLVEKLGRYSTARIHLTSDRARAIRITGRFDVTDTDNTLNTLQSLYGVKISRSGSDIGIQ